MNLISFALTLLGTGSSLGTPLVTCDCDLCRSTDTRDKRLRTSAWLHNENTSILLDCGPDFRQQALRHNIQSVDSVLITHEHFDHIGGIEELWPFFQKAPINIFGQHQSLDAIKNRSFPSFDFPTKLHMNRVDSVFNISDIIFIPIPVFHGNMPIFGYRFGNTAYITDSKFIPESSIRLLDGIEILIVSSCGLTLNPSNFNFNESMELASKTTAKRIFFIHFRHNLKHVAIQNYVDENKHKFGLENKEVTVSYDGLTIEGINPYPEIKIKNTILYTGSFSSIALKNLWFIVIFTYTIIRIFLTVNQKLNFFDIFCKIC